MVCLKKFQTYNPKTKRFVKIKKMENGKTKIVDVKTSKIKIPFKGVKIK